MRRTRRNRAAVGSREYSIAAPADVQVVLVPQSIIAIPDPAAAASDIAWVSSGWSWHALLLAPLKDFQEDLDGRGSLEVFCNCDVFFVHQIYGWRWVQAESPATICLGQV